MRGLWQPTTIPLSDAVLYDHLTGKHTVGVYPLLEDDTCHFLAIDFDEAEWREDARAFVQSCTELGVRAAIEISRSGNGAHVWVFFASQVPARDARRLGTAIISHTCSRTRQLQLASYDRLFPNQDTMPKGGFGNLIALPLQKIPHENGCSVFVDGVLRPFDDQWAFLASIQPMAPHDIEPTILRATGGGHPLGFVAHHHVSDDIFEHLIAILPEFGLRLFQQPTGGDLRSLHLQATVPATRED